MKIFVSHAKEDQNDAQELAVRLRAYQHEVYLASDYRKSGTAFDKEIFQEIKNCDIFIFLISSHSVNRECYTISELRAAEEKWRDNIDGRILPVELEPVNFYDLPAALRGITIENSEGNKIANAIRAVEALAAKAPLEQAPAIETRMQWDQLDREGLRAFIQRAETRLGTMHRVGGGFISGAGLLILMPFIFRDSGSKYFSILSAQI